MRPRGLAVVVLALGLAAPAGAQSRTPSRMAFLTASAVDATVTAVLLQRYPTQARELNPIWRPVFRTLPPTGAVAVNLAASGLALWALERLVPERTWPVWVATAARGLAVGTSVAAWRRLRQTSRGPTVEGPAARAWP